MNKANVTLRTALVSGTLLCLTACGASGLKTQAHAALVTSNVLEVAGESVDAARAQALDNIEEEHGDSPDFHARLDREAARWDPLGAALDAARDALVAWVDAIGVARVADEGGDFGFDMLLPLMARAVLLYQDAARIATGLGVAVPELPEGIVDMITVGVDR